MTRRALFHRLQDGAIAVLLAAVAVAEIWVPFDSVQGEGSSLLATVIGVFSCVMLAVRRVWPLASVLAAVIVWPIVFTITPLPVLFWGQFVPLVFAVYSVARHGRGRQSLYGAVAAAALLLFFDFRVAILADPSEVVFHWTVVSLAWFAGRGLRLSEDRAVASALLAAEVETRSREQTLVAIAEERTRIARELHDVVAHSVSVMVVQAGAAEQVVDDDPEFVRSALSTIRTSHRRWRPRRDAPRGCHASTPRRCGHPRPPAGHGQPRGPYRRDTGCGAEYRASGRGRSSGLAGWAGPGRLPHRAGGAHECAPPCLRGFRPGCRAILGERS